MSLVKDIWSIKTFNVLIFDFSEELLIHSYTLSKKETWIIKTKKEFHSIKEYTEVEKSNAPLLIHIKGKGIISRVTELHPNLRDNLTVTGDKNDFYFTEHHQDQAFVSMMRNDKLVDLFDELKSNNKIIFNLTLGPYILAELLDSGIILNDYEIEIQNSKIIKHQKNASSYRNLAFEDQNLNPIDQYAIATVLLLESETKWIFPLSNEVLVSNRNNAKEQKKFVILGVGMLAFVLLFLVGNYFYQNSIHAKNAELENEISAYGSNLSRIDQLNAEIIRKRNLIQNSAVSLSQYLSFYSDQIAISIPKGISLNLLEIYPLKEKLKQKRKVVLDKVIIVKGKVSNSLEMDNWVLNLERFKWISKVEISNFSRTTISSADFEIKIFI